MVRTKGYMAHGDDTHVPAEFSDVEVRLRENRPELTALELDAIKRRTITSAQRKPPSLFTRKKGILMKSRLAVTTVLALGLLMSGTGATLAVSGLSDSGSAGSAQYPNNNSVPDSVLGTQDEGSAGDTSPTAGDTSPVQATRQVSSGDDGSLPFTGFLAIPVLIGGVGMLGAGIAMRRRLGPSDEDGPSDQA